MASEQIMTCSREAGSPVVIPLHKDGGVEDGGLPEWAMIELNGELIAPSTSMPATDKENPDSLLQSDQVELGSVRFVNNKPVMLLGTHELQGRVEDLNQPFCVLEKQVSSSRETAYRVAGLVTRKLLFDKYPKVILR